MSFKVIIVDDEEPARDLLQTYVDKLENLELVAVVDNALSAKQILDEQEVDILLTDIEMEFLTGIDLIKTLRQPPVTIFTTAYSEYALEGYALDIIDYLVKPISFQRFCKAIDKAIELIAFHKSSRNTNDKTSQGLTSDYFFVKTNRKLVKLKYCDLLFVESYGEYVKLYTKDDILLALQTTSFMEKMLPDDTFFRIHRSHIINIDHVKEIDANEVLIDQYRLVISKRSKDSFMKLIKEKGII